MSVEPVQEEQAPESVREVYGVVKQRAGRVNNFLKMLAHKPDVLKTFGPFYQAVWAEGALSPRLKELAYLRTSISNGCAY